MPRGSRDAGSRIGRAFAARRAEGRAALVPFVTAGHPDPAGTGAVLDMLAAEGADVVELGIPFSDPLADGPVIQRASSEAIRQGMDAARTLELLASFRSRSPLPVVLFTYLNPLLRYGAADFVRDARAAGADGILLTDLPLGADPGLEGELQASDLDLIRLVAPTTSPERARRIAGAARGFLYYIARRGVTGGRTRLPESLGREVAALREVAGIPVAVGFGISDPDQAAAVAALADGVVVGSALVDRLGREGVPGAARLVRELRRAMDARA